MARPTTHDDLPDYQRAGHIVANIESEYVVKYPSLGQHLLAALAEAERLGLTVEAGVITLPKTTDELDEALTNAQRLWDNSADRYEAALADPESVEEGIWRKIINDWARENRRPEVEWDVEMSR